MGWFRSCKWIFVAVLTHAKGLGNRYDPPRKRQLVGQLLAPLTELVKLVSKARANHTRCGSTP